MKAFRILLLLVCAAIFPARALLAQSFPPGWTFDDVGSPALGGGAAFSGSVITMEGAGADIWGSADQFSFLHRRISGDATLVVRVSGIQGADAWAKAGLMIRESLDPGSRHAFAIASRANGLAFQRRVSTGASSAHTSGAATPAPVWLKLERRSSTFTASSSGDGVAWTTIGSTTIDMSATVYAGLALTSHDPSAPATAQFGDLQLAGAAVLLPPEWTAADIGASVVPGAAAFANGWFAVRGAGNGIWDLSDQFTYVYQPVSGDVDIIAAAAYLQGAQPWGKAGLMVRASLDAEAAHASLFASVSRGLAFQRRPAAALPSIHSTGGAGSAPVWLKLERRGSAVTAFRSADGASWAMIGSETLALPPVFYVGLAVTSHDAATAATALFTAVSVSPAGPPPVPLTTAVFIPSSDHDTPVLTSYRLEIFAAGDDPATAPPVSVRDLGKPAVVAGECRAGIAETIAALPPGSYVAAVSAVGPGGSSARVLSDAFSR